MHYVKASFLTLVFALAPLWAGPPDVLDAPGVHNFHQVGDHVYRGAQPTHLGFTNLAKLGVRTVVDLREGREVRGGEKNIVESAGMHYVHIPLDGLKAPTDQQIATVFAILNDPSGWPVFVHCRRGADRTGTVIACYRIAHDGWDNQKALSEAKMHGMSSLEMAMKQYILHFEPPRKSAQADVKPATQ
jgi:uncharacterized protein (TIGR01244 family)